jgi:hypothetical protein
MRESEQNHIAQDGKQSEGDEGPVLAAELARLIEELKQGLKQTQPDQSAEEIAVTAQAPPADQKGEVPPPTEPSGAKSFLFTFQNNSDEQTVISIKADTNEDMDEDASQRRSENLDEFSADGDFKDTDKSSYRMPSF